MNTQYTPQQFAVIYREFSTTYEQAYKFLADPANLPKWALAFLEADQTYALMQLPDGSKARVSMKTKTSIEFGVIDWHITLPNDHVEIAYSRLSRLSNGHCLYQFNFNVRSVEDDKVQETLIEQKAIVEQEFDNLEKIFEELNT